MPRFVSVAVPVPFLDLLTYRVPDEMALPVRGARLVVPLGRRVVTGIAVGPAEVPADRAIKNIVAVLDGIPGAYEHAMQSLERARAGETIALDEL